MKESSKRYDVFAQIGREAILPGAPSLVEPEPPAEAQVPWLLPTIRQVPALESPTLDQDLASFQQGLDELRNQYRPFLADYAPPSAMTRPKQAIEQWSFRYQQADDGGHFAKVLEGQGEWKWVTLPDFRGPTGGDGRWTGYYRSQFNFHRDPGRRAHLIFDGVDYRSRGAMVPSNLRIVPSGAGGGINLVSVKAGPVHAHHGKVVLDFDQ